MMRVNLGGCKNERERAGKAIHHQLLSKNMFTCIGDA
jgi:hypothetical protein